MAVSRAQSFTMHGAREAMQSGLAHIGEQVKAIEQAVEENPGLAFDLAKTLIETTCKSILDERKIGFANTDDLPQLFKSATQRLPFLPRAQCAASDVRQILEQTLRGLRMAVQGVCELRNRCGFASHGSGQPKPAMEAVQALLAAESADAIVGFLYRVHCEGLTRITAPPTKYEDFEEFNEHVDNSVGMLRVFDVELRPSAVLFELEPETYRVYLAEFAPEPVEDVIAESENTQEVNSQ